MVYCHAMDMKFTIGIFGVRKILHFVMNEKKWIASVTICDTLSMHIAQVTLDTLQLSFFLKCPCYISQLDFMLLFPAIFPPVLCAYVLFVFMMVSTISLAMRIFLCYQSDTSWFWLTSYSTQANDLFKRICLKLDALSHFHFAPKPVCDSSLLDSSV